MGGQMAPNSIDAEIRGSLMDSQKYFIGNPAEEWTKAECQDPERYGPLKHSQSSSLLCLYKGTYNDREEISRILQKKSCPMSHQCSMNDSENCHHPTGSTVERLTHP